MSKGTEVILDIKKAANKVTFGTVSVTFITDPFNPVTSRQVGTDLHGRTLDTYLKGYCLGAQYLVKVNGKLIEGDYSSYVVQPNDSIVYVSVIAGGGGGGKQILALVAMIALTIIAPGIGTAAGAAMFGAGTAAAAVAGTILTASIMVAGALLINSVLAPDAGSMGGISSPEVESRTYSWDGIQTSRDLNTAIPVLYGTHALGGTVINNRFYYKGSDDWMATQIALCHGEIEAITAEDIKVQEAEFSTFVGNPVGSDGFFEYASGKFDQPIMTGFGDSIFNNGAVTRKLEYNVPYTFTTESTNIDFFRLHFEFPKGLYSMDTQGVKSSRTVQIEAKYRKVGTSTWSYLYSRTPQYVTEYHYGEYDGDYNIINTFWSRVSTLGNPKVYPHTRKVQDGYTTLPYLEFTDKSSVAIKKYFEPTLSNGVSITLANGQYEFEIKRLTADDSSTDVYNISDSHVRFIEEINTLDVNYGGIAMLGINIKATDQLSSQRPNFITTVSRKAIKLAGTYRESTNPAWICYDILTNKHYGMGLDASKINLAEFTRWAAFCDGTINNTFNLVKPSTAVTSTNRTSSGQLVIPQTELPAGEVLTLSGLKKSLSTFVGTGEALVNSVYVEKTLDIDDITKVTRVYENGTLGRAVGYYYYITFTYPIKLSSTFLYTLVHKTKTTEVTPKLQFNGVFDTTSDVWTGLQEVAKVGRGQVILQGTKYSCIYDTPKTVSGLYNAANSNNITVNYISTADIASELEIQYADRNIGYEMTSLSIQDSTSMNSGVRSNKASHTVKGITSEAEALVYGRYLLATSKYIRRVVTLDADIESITQSVGDLIAVQTDVTQYGKGGLVKSAVGQLVTLDDMIYLEEGQEYTLKIKRASDDFIKDYNFTASVTSPLNSLTFDSFPTTTVGVITFDDLALVVHEVNGSSISTNTLIIPEGYEITKDDRYSFGLRGSDSILCIITDISRDGDLTRRITAAEYNESILDFNYDNDILQRIQPTLRPKNELSRLKISDRLVKTDSSVVAMLSLTWDSKVTSYYNMYIMEEGFKNYLVMGIKDNRYEYPALDLIPETSYRIYIEDANDMGVFTYLDYSITAFSSPPPAITSFTTQAVGNTIKFSVNYPNKPLDFKHYEVYLDGTLISNQISDQFEILAILNKTSYAFKLIPVDMINKKGNQITGTLSITSPTVSSVSYTLEKEYVVFKITPTVGSFPIASYKVTATGVNVTSTDGTIEVLANWVGTKAFSITVKDALGLESVVYSPLVNVNVVVPTPLNLTSSILGKDAEIKWENPTIGLPIDYYEVEYDGNIYKTKTTQYRIPIYWLGSKTFKVRAVNTLGSKSTDVTTAINISTGIVQNLKAEVIDNNVLLKWEASQGSLPIENFILYKGATEANLVNIGEKKGTFTTVFESQSGTYTYWMAAVDSAGNIGAKTSVTTMVAQPPDYVLNVNWTSTLNGMLSSAKLENSKVYLPINTTETIQGHFTSRSWTTPQQQINAGYPLWVEPFNSAGSYTEVFDYGTTLASSMVSVGLDKTIIKGSPVVSITTSVGVDSITPISTTGITGNGTTGTVTYATQASAPFTVGSLVTISGVTPSSWNGTYTVLTCTTTSLTFRTTNTTTATIQGKLHKVSYTDYNQTQVYGTGFRFIKVKVDVTGTNSLLSIQGLSVRLDSKLINDAGSDEVTVASTGKVVTFNKPFIDISSITVTPVGSSSPIIAIYDFLDVANPTQFTVYLYNTSGTKITGKFSWAARGY